MASKRTEARHPGGAERSPRGLAFTLAVALALSITAYPAAAVGAAGRPPMGLLALLFWGISAGFVYGVGFAPRATAWQLAFGPWVALPLMALGALALARNVLG